MWQYNVIKSKPKVNPLAYSDIRKRAEYEDIKENRVDYWNGGFYVTWK